MSSFPAFLHKSWFLVIRPLQKAAQERRTPKAAMKVEAPARSRSNLECGAPAPLSNAFKEQWAAHARILILLIALLLLPSNTLGTALTIDPNLHHLGVVSDPEWDEFRNKPIEGPRLELKLPIFPHTNVATLLWRQKDVKGVWSLQINGKTLTNLFVSEDDLVMAVPLPAGLIWDGTSANRLTIVPPKERDNIEVGEFRWDYRSLQKVLGEGSFTIDAGQPCRVTIVNQQGSLVPFLVDAKNSAARPGVVYLGEGKGRISLPFGNYTVHVGRGFEYSLFTKKINVKPGRTIALKPKLRREVDTRGYVASDTHVHTFTYSRHGDATADERAITLAGEGIELPVATDHNIVIDPAAHAKATGMDKYFTPIPGNEVTTGHAHFNLFPLQPGATPPDFRINDWPELMRAMRATPGAQVVVLNHPRNIHNRFQPFASTNFNAQTGENLRGFEFSFDAVEVVNSSALQSDWMVNFRDWMALLNYGYRVTGLGSSDGHDVSRYIVGQGRTYVACDDADPSSININNACQSILKGRALISMGLLANIQVNGKWGVGDLATNLDKTVSVTATVQGPSWTAVDQVELYANGELVKSEHFSPIWKSGLKKKVTWKIPRAAIDQHLIVIASGPPVTAPYWRIPKPYQPTSTTWKPRVIGATNPVWLDGDGDGKFTPLRLAKQK